jgi:hypothetical protein
MNNKLGFLLTSTLATFLTVNSATIDKNEPPCTRAKIVQNEKISPTLFKILKVIKIQHDSTLASRVDATQKEWL